MIKPLCRSRTVSSRCGFSLLELTVVIIILATLGAIALPRYTNSMSRQRARTWAWQIQGDLTRTGELARANGEPYSFKLSTTNRAYAIYKGDAEATSTRSLIQTSDRLDTPARPLTGAWVYKLSTGRKDTTILFNGWGEIRVAGYIQIQAGTATSAIIFSADSNTVRTADGTGANAVAEDPEFKSKAMVSDGGRY